MQMGPTGTPQPMRPSPDQLVAALMPLVQEAMQAHESGAALSSVLREAVLTGFLAGRGMAPAAATELVQQWRSSGMSRELMRDMRTPAPMRTAIPQQAQPMGTMRRTELLQKIEESIQDEVSATAFYGQLEQAAESPPVKDYIRHAKEDEQKHARLLQDLYRDLTGRTFAAQPQPVPFANLLEGLKRALDDELEAAESYREIYLANRDERIRAVFFELMTDEMEHATRFTWAQWYLEEFGGEAEQEG